MSQVKAFFPVKAKNERKFLKIISNSVDDYCTITFRYISIILIAVIMIASTLEVIKLHNDYKTLKDTAIYDYEETIE